MLIQLKVSSGGATYIFNTQNYATNVAATKSG
jgi:hypothetical protein